MMRHQQGTPGAAWVGELTIYASATNTRPAQELQGLTWVSVMDALAPGSTPLIRKNKAKLPYFTPGSLRHDVQLRCKTLERARARGESEVGPMRSAAHVTSTTFLVFDFDGVSRDAVQRIGSLVLGKGRAGLMYTTHSYGRSDKPGARIRLVFPVDMRLDAPGYRRVHEVMNTVMFEGIADRSGNRLSQQQAVFGAHPARAMLAKCWRHEGEVFPLREFIAEHGQAATPNRHRAAARQAFQATATAADLPTLERLNQAMPFLYAGTYSDWTKGIVAFKALSPNYPAGSLRELAIRFGNTSPSESTRAQAAETDARYNPGDVFDTAAPTMPPNIAAGVLLAMAKERAVRYIEAARGSRTANPKARAAASYVAAHHRNTWKALIATSSGSAR
jgi:hypothetical protein